MVGMMGAGKTTVGRLVADRLGYLYLDSDTEVAAATGRTVPENFAAEGEGAFRAAESAALRDALSGTAPVVVSVAGGAVLDPANRELLRNSGTVVWLRATPATLAARVGDGAGRPLLDGDPSSVLARLDGERRPLYAEVADVVVDVDGVAPAAVAEQVLARVAAIR
jgi:shikimate kinase